MTNHRTPLLAFLALMLLVAACGESDEAATPTPDRGDRPAAALLTPTAGPEPIAFPNDEAPHDVLTEWWYYTGHMMTEDGTRYGFEFVFFQSQRGEFPTGYASHFAITDSANDRFLYDQRIGTDANQNPEEGFHLRLDDWEMSGANGQDHLVASLDDISMELSLTDTKGPALHDDIGYFDMGEAGGSYYYSRTRMEIDGSLTIDGEEVPVQGDAWMDHQWGDFVVPGVGGWDWFAFQLDSGDDLMVFVIRDENDDVVLTFGSLVDPEGSVESIGAEEIAITETDTWTSEESGATYPSAWTIDVDTLDLSLNVRPTMADQELDTRATTGVIYWEGEVEIDGIFRGESIGGLGYVELTGYASDPSFTPGS
ncbi:MAG: lipocalin-like domain-containing protein [Chloroflexota bacterium]